MTRFVPVLATAECLLAHTAAALAAGLFALAVSGTALVTTGVQFIAPLGVILTVHVVWIGLLRGNARPFARLALHRMLITALLLALAAPILAIVMPMPAAARPAWPESLTAALSLLVCFMVIALVMAAAAALIWGLYLAFSRLRRAWRGSRNDGPGSRLGEFGTIGGTMLLIASASLEGVWPATMLATPGVSASTWHVAAPTGQVWRQVGRATSPAFPLPILLRVLPRPVAVVQDDGAVLGGRRVVHFQAREGEGDLTLMAVQRDERRLVYAVESDTSPIARWMRQNSLTFEIIPEGAGTLLTVTLEYDRLLSPAWFFRPFVGIATTFAVDTLARDTRDRAEAR